MARVRLSLRSVGPGLPFLRSDDPATVARIPLHRLYTKLVVVPRGAAADTRPPDLRGSWCPDAVIDTGAPLSIFPYGIWEPFAAEVWWLEQPPREDGRERRVTILGGSFAYRLGRVRVGAVDEDARWLPARWHSGFFLRFHEDSPPEAILGLGSPLFHGRQLRHVRGDAAADPTPAVWWLEDA